MRLVATSADRATANLSAAVLATEKINAKVEHWDGAWSVWVIEEDDVTKAKDLLTLHSGNPNDERFTQAATIAREISKRPRRSDLQPSVATNRQIVDFQLTGVFPILLVMAGLSTFVYLLTTGPSQESVLGQLTFVNGSRAVNRSFNGVMWNDILAGELWRLITPMFIHFSIWHLLLNLLSMWAIGRQIEYYLGPITMVAFSFAVAIVSNIAQAFFEPGTFGGLSGVIYGMFGFVWVHSFWHKQSPLYINEATVIAAIIFLIMGFMMDTPTARASLDSVGATTQFANWAHAFGLLAGMAFGLLPVRKSFGGAS